MSIDVDHNFEVAKQFAEVMTEAAVAHGLKIQSDPMTCTLGAAITLGSMIGALEIVPGGKPGVIAIMTRLVQHFANSDLTGGVTVQ